MPVYNAGDFLVEAIESIRNQSYSNWELVVVDDCSTDNSWKILQELASKDKRIKVFKNRTKKYLSGSLNFALKKARGEYIARMDADDISLPWRFKKQIELLEENAQLVAVGGHEEIINETGEITGFKKFPVSPKECREVIINYMAIQPPVLMARAEVMKNLRYDTKMAKNDDIDLHFQLLQHGELGNVDDFIFQYRMRNDSLTHSKVKAVYFMALKVRLRAIFKYGYRPNLFRFLLLPFETGLVALLPPELVMRLFELLRVNPTPKIIPQKAAISS